MEKTNNEKMLRKAIKKAKSKRGRPKRPRILIPSTVVVNKTKQLWLEEKSQIIAFRSLNNKPTWQEIADKLQKEKTVCWKFYQRYLKRGNTQRKKEKRKKVVEWKEKQQNDKIEKLWSIPKTKKIRSPL